MNCSLELNNLNGFYTLQESELFLIDGDAGLINIVAGISGVAGVVGCFFPPALVVAGAGSLFIVGYGIGEALRG